MSLFFFWKKTKNVQEMIEEYLKTVDICMNLFQQAATKYIEKGECCDEIRQLNKDTHKAESAADDLRREIELKLYGKALLPESRGDLLGLLESLDKIPGAAENVINLLSIEQPEIPEDFKEDFLDMLEENMSAYYLVKKAVDAIMNNPRETLYVDKEIDEKESASDKIQQKLLIATFKKDIDLARKYQLKNLIGAIGAVSDRCQDSGDRMSIIAIKRRV